MEPWLRKCELVMHRTGAFGAAPSADRRLSSSAASCESLVCFSQFNSGWFDSLVSDAREIKGDSMQIGFG